MLNVLKRKNAARKMFVQINVAKIAPCCEKHKAEDGAEGVYPVFRGRVCLVCAKLGYVLSGVLP